MNYRHVSMNGRQ